MEGCVSFGLGISFGRLCKSKPLSWELYNEIHEKDLFPKEFFDLMATEIDRAILYGAHKRNLAFLEEQCRPR
jgi:hypothetical protein